MEKKPRLPFFMNGLAHCIEGHLWIPISSKNDMVLAYEVLPPMALNA